MSTQAVETFLETLDQDENLKRQLDAAVPKTPDPAHIVAFASRHGFDFTSDELEQHAASFAQQPPPTPAGELSEDQMGEVVGGFGSYSFSTAYSASATQLLRSVYYAGVVANRLA
jgi:predicted ribosomally synthesized peptide with nif11-like leader